MARQESTRSAFSSIRSVLIVAKNTTPVVGASTGRTTLVFTAPPEATYALSTDHSASTGLILGSTPIELTAARHGDAVEKAWYATNLTGTLNLSIGILEVVGG
jgi:hypothetical protein